MRIITNKDLYVGRIFNLTPDKRALVAPIDGVVEVHGDFCFHAIIPVGETEPFKIPKFTEVVKMDGTEFDSFEEFTKAYEDGYFDYKFGDEHKNEVFWNLINCANMVNDCPEDYQIS